MASLFAYIIAILFVAVLIVIVSIISYNRHLDKVTKGETHDTHSSIPEPKTTAGVVYKTILMGAVILTFLTVSTISGTVSDLQSRINNLESDVRILQMCLEDMRTAQDERDSRIESFETNVGEADFEAGTAPVDVKLILKEYTDETKVKLLLGDTEIEMQNDGYGVFSCSVLTGLYETYIEPKALIYEPGRTYSEIVDYPSELFYQYLPMPGYECHFNADSFLGKPKYSGEYCVIIFGDQNDIESASLTYVSNGRDIKTMDVTEKIMNCEWTTLEKGFEFERDLTFRLEIVTKDGFRIVEQSMMIFDAIEYPEDYEYERVYDADGTLLWENDYK